MRDLPPTRAVAPAAVTAMLQQVLQLQQAIPQEMPISLVWQTLFLHMFVAYPTCPMKQKFVQGNGHVRTGLDS